MSTEKTPRNKQSAWSRGFRHINLTPDEWRDIANQLGLDPDTMKPSQAKEFLFSSLKKP